jgi:hypothetical protein
MYSHITLKQYTAPSATHIKQISYLQHIPVRPVKYLEYSPENRMMMTGRLAAGCMDGILQADPRLKLGHYVNDSIHL